MSRAPAPQALAAVVLAVALAPGAAGATPLLELAGGVGTQGGWNARVVEAGAASAYFNPAFLPDVESGLELGVFVLSTQIGVRVQARPGAAADVPVASVDAARPGGGRFVRHGVPTEWLERGKPASPPDEPLPPRPRQGAGSGHGTRAYQVIGLAQRLMGGRLGVGLYALLPYGRLSRGSAFYADEREQYFSNSLHPELYGNRMASAALALGAGARLHERLSVGVAFTIGLRASAVTPTYVEDVGRFRDILVDAQVGAGVALAPHAGAVFRAAEHTRLALTVHSPQNAETEAGFSFLLANGLEQGASVRFVQAYVPWTFGLGAAHDFGDVGVAATALYALWSAYVDRHGEHPSAAYGWRDTLAGSAGLRYRRGAARAFADFVYMPSPVPEQTGRSSFVDNDRAGANLGLELRRPLWGGTVRAGVQAQVHRLIARETGKAAPGQDLVVDEVPDDAVVGSEPLAGREGLQTNNAGWPGFASAGWIVGAGVSVGFVY